MNTRRFCLPAVLALSAIANPLFAARRSRSDEQFNVPEATGHPLADVIVGLGVGVALGWILLSVRMTMYERQDREGL
jgi:hypothetical protein